MATQHDTAGIRGRQSLSEKLDHILQAGLDWVVEHSQAVVASFVLFLVVGGAAAGAYEWSRSRRMEAQTQLARVDRDYRDALPSNPLGLGVIEPANPELAEQARQTAIEGFTQVARENPGTTAAGFAEIRAAEIEIELGRLEAAADRLSAVADSAREPIQKATALRLEAYVLEELDRAGEAAKLYGEVGAITEYPGRAAAYIQAAQAHERAGALDEAAKAYEAVGVVDPNYANQLGIPARLDQVRAALEVREANSAAGRGTEPAGGDDPAAEAPVPAPDVPTPAPAADSSQAAPAAGSPEASSGSEGSEPPQ